MRNQMYLPLRAPADETGGESPADKLKRQKAERAQQDALDAEKKKLEDAAVAEQAGIDADNKALAEKQRLADEKSAKDDAAMKAHQAKVDEASKAATEDDESDGEDEQPALRPGQTRLPPDNTDDRAAAIKSLENIAISYPLTTPDSHVIFGFAGIRFTLGELRAIFNLRRS